MNYRIKAYLLSVFFFCFKMTLFSQTILVDHKSDDPNDLWAMGASDVMSFYLQEQGVQVVHRDQLSSMINELSLADAEITKSEIRKGAWKGADYIINGKISENSHGLLLNITTSYFRINSLYIYIDKKRKV